MASSPEQLAEHAARALLAEWLARDAEFAPLAPTRDALEHTRVEVHYLHSDVRDLEATRARALALRRSMEALNALACCRGFAVDENAAFWRREFALLVDRELGVLSANFHAFAPDMLTKFRVSTAITASPEATAYAIVSCFSMDPASEAMHVRKQIHSRLQRYLTRVPPLLDLEMDPLLNAILRDKSPADYWRLVKRSVLRAAQMWNRPAMPVELRPERITMVCATTVDGGALLEISELLAVHGFEMREMRLIIAEEDPAEVAGELGIFMRELVRVDTVRKMTWCFTCCDRACLEAVFSAIPSMRSLVSFSVQCDDLAGDATIPLSSTDMNSYYTWLAYALTSCQLEARSVAAGVELVKGADTIFNRVLRSPRTLVDFLPFQDGRQPVGLPYGSSASLRSQLVLSTDITPAEKLREPTASFVAEQGQRVDIIALFDSRAIVVWPGFGLVCVDPGHLHDWKTRSSSSTNASSSIPHNPIVRDLTCWRSEAAAVAAFVGSVGVDVRRLYLGKIGSDDKDVFQQILKSCPHLDTLFVSSLDVIEPLISAYENETCGIATLKLGSVSNSALYVVFRTLDDRTSLMASRVQRLCVEVSTLSEDDVATAAMMLTWNRRLEYLRLCELLPNDDETGLHLLSGFVDQPTVQTARSKRGAYTFLLSTRRHGVLRSLALACVRAIVEFAAEPLLRHVSWEQCS